MLAVVQRAPQAIGPQGLAAWVLAEPTGPYSRRASFLDETLTGRSLDLDGVSTGRYYNVLDERRHCVAAQRNAARQRDRDNLLGTGRLCPTLRRTARREVLLQARLAERTQALAAQYPPDALARAVSFLYTKETRSSFATRGEPLSSQREQRFLEALQQVASFDSGDPAALVALQRSVVNPRYAPEGWRASQNSVAATTRGFG